MSKCSPSPTMGYYKPGSYGTLTNLKRLWWNNGGNWYILKDSLIYLYNDEHNIKRSGQESIKTSSKDTSISQKIISDYGVMIKSLCLQHGYLMDIGVTL